MIDWKQIEGVWIGYTSQGTIKIERTSWRPLGTPWRITYPTRNTARAMNIDDAKDQAEVWLALRERL